MNPISRVFVLVICFTAFINASCATSSPSKLLNSPSPRSGHGMVYDEYRNVSILFGGASNLCDDQKQDCLLNDTWEFDGATWQQVVTQNLPSPRSSFAFTYNLDQRKAVLFGGYADGKELNDTWEYDGQNWSLIAANNLPLFLDFPQMTYSRNRQSIILFGYSEANNRHETWEYKEGGWELLDFNFVDPLPSQMTMRVIFPSLIDNPVSDTILLQPQLNLTFEFDYSNWRYIPQRDSKLPRYLAHKLIYDSVNDRVMLINADKEQVRLTLWEYVDKEWIEVSTPVSPSYRLSYSVVYDKNRDKIVIFGGDSFDGLLFNDTWEYDGTTWVQR